MTNGIIVLRNRSLHRHGAWAAITALVLQFALAFGHIHAEDFARISLDRQTVASFQTDRATPGSSGGQFPDAGAHSDCAICAAISLVGSAYVSGPVRIPVPVAYASVVWLTTDGSGAPQTSIDLLRTRAPPAV